MEVENVCRKSFSGIYQKGKKKKLMELRNDFGWMEQPKLTTVNCISAYQQQTTRNWKFKK